MLLVSTKIFPENLLFAFAICANILEHLYEVIGHLLRQNRVVAFWLYLGLRTRTLCSTILGLFGRLGLVDLFVRLPNEGKVSVIVNTNIRSIRRGLLT